MIQQYLNNIKSWIYHNKSDLYTAAIIFFVGISSFGLGRLSAVWPEKEAITITNSEFQMPSAKTNGKKNLASGIPNLELKGKYVVSKSGTAYHYPWCAGAQKIKEENKIWFQTKEEAEDRGYKPAGNCEGL